MRKGRSAATFAGRKKPLDWPDARLSLATLPFLTIKIMTGIHWEALKLWLKAPSTLLATTFRSPRQRDRQPRPALQKPRNELAFAAIAGGEALHCPDRPENTGGWTVSNLQDLNQSARDAVTLTAENISRIVKGLPFKAKLALRGLMRMQHGSLGGYAARRAQGVYRGQRCRTGRRVDASTTGTLPIAR